MTPAQAIQRHANLLSPFEQSEILEYPEVRILAYLLLLDYLLVY
jgi:hypothetical protein